MPQNQPNQSPNLRQRAEETVQDQLVDVTTLSTGDIQHLVHELQVHQIELEMQNEELRQSQLQLVESRDKYVDLYDFAPVGYFTVCDKGLILEANLTGATMLGLDRSRLLKKPFSRFVARDDKDTFYLHLKQVFKTKTRQVCELKLVKQDDAQFEARLESVRKDDEGEFNSFRTAIMDISQRKQLEEQLRQAQKMEAVGQMAAGIAHNFNNMLTAILGCAELSLNEISSIHPVSGYLIQIKETSQRAADLTKQLMTLTRHSFTQVQSLNLNDLVVKTSSLLKQLISEAIELVIELESNLEYVKVDPGQLEQVLVNLVINAHDAMPGGGKVTIITANTTLDRVYAAQHPGVIPGNYVRLTVSDTGQGMTPAVQARIFEPFFTTKDVGQGTGLGLATCFGIIKQHNGHISVHSQAGQGTTFKIYLPSLIEKVPNLSFEKRQAGPLPRGVETILLVEDEADVRSLIAHMLRRQGYTVLEAGDGEEALGVIGDKPETGLDLLLTDAVMPRMGGNLLAERLRPTHPNLKVLFMSGYADEVVAPDILKPGTAFLPKPFTSAILIRKVRQVLDEL